MSSTGGSDELLVQAREVLLDALVAIEAHRSYVVVIGAQAIYLHTGSAPVAVAEATKDSDLGIDVRTLGDDPIIDDAMRRGGFFQDLEAGQPGAWLSPDGIPVDLMVPHAIAGRGRRSVEAPPHGGRAFRRAVGLEAAMVDNAEMPIPSLVSGDLRQVTARVAGPAALMVAKLHKLGERHERAPQRLVDKDAYDIYRLLVAVPTSVLAGAIARLLADDFAGEVSRVAMEHLAALFAQSDGTGSVMAGRAEEFVGDPAVVSAACAALTGDVLAALGR